jgi:hypothetical protein
MNSASTFQKIHCIGEGGAGVRFWPRRRAGGERGSPSLCRFPAPPAQKRPLLTASSSPDEQQTTAEVQTMVASPPASPGAELDPMESWGDECPVEPAASPAWTAIYGSRYSDSTTGNVLFGGLLLGLGIAAWVLQRQFGMAFIIWVFFSCFCHVKRCCAVLEGRELFP